MPSPYREEWRILISEEDNAGTQKNLNEQGLLGFLLAWLLDFVLNLSRSLPSETRPEVPIASGFVSLRKLPGPVNFLKDVNF